MFTLWENIWYTINMDKNIFTIRENDLSYGRGYVYSLQYHLVWCTKYRKKVLQNGLDEECKKMLYEIADEYKFPDCGYGGYARSYSFVGRLQTTVLYFGYDQNYKRKSGTAAFSFSSGIKTELWEGHLWNPSYCAVTVSDRSKEQVLTYIKGQKEKEAGK